MGDIDGRRASAMLALRARAISSEHWYVGEDVHIRCSSNNQVTPAR